MRAHTEELIKRALCFIVAETTSLREMMKTQTTAPREIKSYVIAMIFRI